MEKVQNFKHCPWASDEINIKDVRDHHLECLKSTFDVHPSKEHFSKACESFFKKHISFSAVDEQNETEKLNFISHISNSDQLEADCSIDLLTVPNEMPANDRLDDTHAKMTTNWFEGSYSDCAIPEGGLAILHTLKEQDKELEKRMSVGDYSTLRYRTFKYFSTIRLPIELNTEPISSNFVEDVVINIRIHRPFFKKTHFKKQCNSKFPLHSQELMFLGSQRLSDLRDSIVCVNDHAVHLDVAKNPGLQLVEENKRAKDAMPSGLFYINGTFFTDMRNKLAKDYSENLLRWAAKQHDHGEYKVEEMSDARLSDLTIRLGFPYLYLHQGDCEHLLTFTDVRLKANTDPIDVSCYPIARGHSSKLSVRCCTCNRNAAVWVVVGCCKMPIPRAHVCNKCLKLFCYDVNDEPVNNFKLFRYYDESLVLLETSKKEKTSKRMKIDSLSELED